MSLPGRQIYIFLTLIFLFLVPSRGIKFAIFDVARCRMSATSLTFLFFFGGGGGGGALDPKTFFFFFAH